MKIFFWALIFVFCQTIFGQKISPQGFAIYLLPDNIKPNQLKKLDLKKLRPTGKPLIAENEIRYYQKETHEFRIDYPAADRLKKINNRGSGKTFAVFVGRNLFFRSYRKK